MDTIYITGLRVETLVGVYEWERESRQPLRLDLELRPAPGAALSDGAREAALDYAKVVAEVRTFVGSREDALLETLAEALCTRLFERFPAASITLRIDKPQAALLLGCEHVGLVIERQRAA
jgi:dihydroneopterin aldolase